MHGLPGEVKVKVLPPYQTRGMTMDQVGELAKTLHDKMQDEFDLLNKEIKLDEKYYIKSTNRVDDRLDENNNLKKIN